MNHSKNSAATLLVGATGCAHWKRRSLRLLVTTKMLERPIEAPAINGLSRPAAANGLAAMLYAKAQNRLVLI